MSILGHSYCLLYEVELDLVWTLTSDVPFAYFCEPWENSELGLNLWLRPCANNAL